MRAYEKAAIARAEGCDREAAYWQGIADLVEAAPTLTQAQRDKLRVLLRPDVSPASERQAA